ncbi:myelin-oligodendrocyte glycoprotein-like isoform X1 [Myotis yumanensis]|uniref:myelin-oligodendrocyte glycoprotein-like isoform X1 n=1 Tax=Myotis yumanensis TaxID=159337 RepID=UPI0038D125B6
MEFTAHTLFGCFPVIFFLVIPIASSELFTVDSPVGPLVALVGEEVKLHCHISPAQNAEHMEIYWYHKSFTKPLQLYHRGNDHYRETSLDNIKRTEILKEDIGKGNITLRIQNVSVSDGGKYRCLFKDANFTKEAVQELKVLDILFQQHNFQKKVTHASIISNSVLFGLSVILAASYAYLNYRCGRRSILTGRYNGRHTSFHRRGRISTICYTLFGPLYMCLKMIILLTTPSVVSITIIYTYVKFGIQGSQFSMTKVSMMRILPETFISMFTTNILILLPHFWIKKLFLNR